MGIIDLQIIFNMFRQRPAELFFREAAAKNIGIIVRVPLASGLLSGKMSPRSIFTEDDHRRYNRLGESFDVGETFAGVPYDVALDAVEAAAREHGVRRTRRLVVAGAFHSECMRPAAERLARALADVPIRAPQVPLVTNVTGEPVEDPERIREHLAAQVCAPVLWERSMRWALVASSPSSAMAASRWRRASFMISSTSTRCSSLSWSTSAMRSGSGPPGWPCFPCP